MDYILIIKLSAIVIIFTGVFFIFFRGSFEYLSCIVFILANTGYLFFLILGNTAIVLDFIAPVIIYIGLFFWGRKLKKNW
jgi:hypothetical protein